MAILKLTIHDVKISKDDNLQVENDLVLSTEQKANSRGTLVLVKKDVELTSKDDKKRIYSLTLQNLEFTKKMYQPTEIHAEIALAFSNPDLAWIPVMGSVIEELFVNKKVSLRDMQDEDPQKLSDSKKVGDDFYVQSVQMKYKVNYMRIYLHIYSLDKEICGMFLSEEVCIVCHNGSFCFFLGCDVLAFYVKVVIGEGSFVGQLFLMAVGEVAP